jgi:two-component system sensor histidine kinase DctS
MSPQFMERGEAFCRIRFGTAIVDFRRLIIGLATYALTSVMGSPSKDIGNRSTPGRWLWLLPRSAFLLFVAGVGALLWISHQKDMEEQRANLINDMLWLEQNLRFQLVRNEELLGQIGVQETQTSPRFESHARVLLTNSTGLRQILWIDLSGIILRSAPSARSDYLVGEEQGVVPSLSLSRLASALGKPVYSSPYPIIDDDWQFEAHIPVFRGERVVGVAVAIYSLQRIIDESVPWWLSERYRISVTDDSGKQLASRSKINPTQTGISYQLTFDPPGHGLLLSATPYQTPLPVINRMVAAALILLAVAVLVSLWMLRRHVQHRLSAEDALKDEHAFRQAMDRSMQTGMRVRDLDGRIAYVNSAFCRMVGWTAEELVGLSPPMPYWAENSIERTRELNDRVLAGDGPHESFELAFQRRSGEQFAALIHEAPLIDGNGIQTGWMGSVIDISDRKRQEEYSARQQERLQSTARLVAIGEMASGLAHELNQPLAAVSSYCSAALNMLGNEGTPEDIVQPLEKAVEQAQRAGQIVRRFYSLARRSEGNLEPVHLNERVDAVIALVDADFRRRGIAIQRTFETDVIVEGDPVLIEQTLFNLIRNAGEAMMDSNNAIRQVSVLVGEDGGYALLQVTDCGTGISDAVLDKMFDPLFTTKREGMGMGLSICRSIVEYHKGRIKVESNPDGGSIFTVYLPLLVQ